LRALRGLDGPTKALLVLLGLGLVLRIFETAVYSTAVTDYYTGDSGRFMRYGFDGMFSDAWQPAGYPLFLRGVREVSDWLPLTVMLQHLGGLATAALLYFGARRAGAGSVLALLPAAWVVFSAEHLFLEQNILTDAPWIMLVAASLVTLTRGAQARDLRWLAAGGLLLGVSIITRNVSFPLMGLFAVWAFVVWGGGVASASGSGGRGSRTGDRGHRRVHGPGDLRRPVQRSRGDEWLVAVPARGAVRRLHAVRAAGRHARPVRQRPIAERPGPFYWFFEPDSPARRAFP
jgi:hypothetical protein